MLARISARSWRDRARELWRVLRAQEYAGLDVFHCKLWRVRGPSKGEAPILGAVVGGIEERYPPVQEGDVLCVRLADAPDVELRLVVTTLLRRKEMRLLPAWGSTRVRKGRGRGE